MTVGLVPTMGALHDGHRALLRAARAEADRVVMSLFVNPTQFGEGEDFDRYPRDEDRDRAIAAEEGVDEVFAPTVDGHVPDRLRDTVDVGPLVRRFEGASRPGHFAGVATVVLKLLQRVRPDSRLVRPEGCAAGGGHPADGARPRRARRHRIVPTVREPDGLAVSSRNAYLSADERRAGAVAAPRPGRPRPDAGRGRRWTTWRWSTPTPSRRSIRGRARW